MYIKSKSNVKTEKPPLPISRQKTWLCEICTTYKRRDRKAGNENSSLFLGDLSSWAFVGNPAHNFTSS